MKFRNNFWLINSDEVQSNNRRMYLKNSFNFAIFISSRFISRFSLSHTHPAYNDKSEGHVIKIIMNKNKKFPKWFFYTQNQHSKIIWDSLH